MSQKGNVTPGFGFDPAFVEQLKDYYRTHDFTGSIVPYDANNSTPEKDKIYAKAKKFFALSWLEQLPVLGINQRMKNYSKNYPIKCLSEGDGTYIANKTTKIFSDPEQFKTTIDTFFENLEPVLNAGFTACASAHGKSVEDLTDEEIMDVVDKVADLYLNAATDALMLAQQVPEISGISVRLSADSDFNNSIVDNHDKIDHDRKWTHSRTKLGAALSLEQMMVDTPDQVESARDFFNPNGDVEQDEEIIAKQFKEILDEEELRLLDLLNAGKTQTEIAKECGVTQGTVSKRVKNLKEKLIAFMAQ